MAFRRRVIAAILFAALAILFVRYCVVFVPGGRSDTPPVMPGIAHLGLLMIPVAGVGQGDLVDTFTQAREDGARRHDAIDILAPRGTPVLAAAEGRIEKLFQSKRGGTTLYQRSPDGRWLYYYAHLDDYAPGMAEGQGVRRGQAIAFVGSTGDASPIAPHLHFEIHRMMPGQNWYEGEAVNPYPLLMKR